MNCRITWNLKMNELELLKDEDMKYSVLLKLQMIRRVYLTDSAIRNGFLKSIPNIRKLGCNIMGTSMGIDLSHLHKLKILRFFSSCLSRVIFPCNIRKLFLHDCAIKPGELTTLHKLEVLKINRCMFGREGESCDEVWEAADGDIFCSLQFLCLEELRLVRWIADETNFPRLRHLFIEDCPASKGNPWRHWRNPNTPINRVSRLQRFCIGLSKKDWGGATIWIRQLRSQTSYHTWSRCEKVKAKFIDLLIDCIFTYISHLLISATSRCGFTVSAMLMQVGLCRIWNFISVSWMPYQADDTNIPRPSTLCLLLTRAVLDGIPCRFCSFWGYFENCISTCSICMV